MAKLTLTDIAGGYGLVTTYNANNDLIEAALENTLSRDGTSPNSMSADLDMNSNSINNVTDPASAQQAATKGYVDSQVSAVMAAGDFSEALSYTFSGNNTYSGTSTFTSVMYVENQLWFQNGSSRFIFNNDGVNLNINSTGSASNILVQAGTDITLDGGKLIAQDATQAEELEIYLLSSAGAARYVNSNAFGHYFYSSGTNLVVQIEDDQVVFNEPIKMAEASAAVSDNAGYGQIWVKNDTPNNLYFTDDAGNDIQLTEGGAVKGNAAVTGYLTSSSTKATDTTLADEAELSSLVLEANSYYEISGYLKVSQNVGDFKCRFQFNNAPDNFDVTYFAVDQSGVADEFHPTSGASTVQITTMTDTDTYGLRITGYINTDGTGSTLDFQWAQNTSSANDTQIFDGSFITFRKL
jgi:hypothetical protein